MSPQLGRLYVGAGTLAALLGAWALAAGRTWSEPAADARLPALEQREARLREEAALVARLLQLRRATASPARTAPTAPAVRVTTLPPVTSTRSS